MIVVNITKLLNGNVQVQRGDDYYSLNPDAQIYRVRGSLKPFCREQIAVKGKNGSKIDAYFPEEIATLTRRDGTVINNPDLDTLYSELANFFFFKLGSGGANHLGVFDNYTDLITQHPTAALGDLAYVENSQGTFWLPGTMGGNFYSKGPYLWNGSFWDSAVDEIAKQLEDNTNDILSLQLALTNHVNDLANPHDTSDVNLLTSDVVTNDVSTLKHGFAPKLPGDNTKYLDGDGNYTVPAGGGGSEVIINTNTAPDENDDAASGNFVGQRWIDNRFNPRDLYFNTDQTNGASYWEQANFPPQFRYKTIKVVQTLDQFPAPILGDIFLEDDTIYFIDNGDLDILDNTLVFNQRSQINGFGQNVSKISSSHSGTVGNPHVFFRSAKNLFSNDLEIECKGTNQLVWQCLADGTTPGGESFELNRFHVVCFLPAGHNNQLGYIKDIRQGFVGTFSTIGFENGFILAGAWAGGFRVENTIFITCIGVFFGSDVTDPVVFQSRFASNANLTIPTGSIGYNFPETSFTFDGQYQLQGGNVSGTGTYVTDFTSGHPSNDPVGNFRANSGIKNTFPGAEWIATSDNVVAIAIQNVWYKLSVSVADLRDPTWVSYLLGELTHDSDNAVDASIITRMSATGKSNDIVEIKIVKEDALAVQTDLIIASITIQGSAAQGRAENVTIPTTTVIEKDDKLSVWVRNTSGTQNVTILEGANFISGQK